MADVIQGRDREMSSGLLRQRRNLMLAASVSVAYVLLDLKFARITAPFLPMIEVGNPSIIPFALFMSLLYFAWRYYIYYKEENHVKTNANAIVLQRQNFIFELAKEAGKARIAGDLQYHIRHPDFFAYITVTGEGEHVQQQESEPEIVGRWLRKDRLIPATARIRFNPELGREWPNQTQISRFVATINEEALNVHTPLEGGPNHVIPVKISEKALNKKTKAHLKKHRIFDSSFSDYVLPFWYAGAAGLCWAVPIFYYLKSLLR